MPIPFTCPYCGLQTDVAEAYAGQSGPCAGCGKSITVPELGKSASPPARSTPSSFFPDKTVMMTAALVGAVVIGLIGVTVLVATFFAPSLRRPPSAARQLQCSNNLRRIGLAMQRYHDVHGCFPAAYVADENGKPMHSWRVLLLPYLDEQLLFKEYDFSKPWDSPENVRLARRIPEVYACPEDADSVFGDTSYVVVNGAGVIFDGAKKRPAEEISDGLGNTILVVESAGGGVPWMAPRDLEVGSSSLSVNRDKNRGIGSNHRAGGAHVLMADGSVYFFSDRVPTEAMTAMLTVSGAESIAPKNFADP